MAATTTRRMDSYSVIPEPWDPAAAEFTNERLKLRIVDFDKEINKLNCEALDSTRRMVDLLEDVNEEGLTTLAALEDQDEQLDKIEENLYQISDDLTRVRTDINKMQACCFPFRKLFRNPLRKIKKTRLSNGIPTPDSARSPTSSLVVKHSFNNKTRPEKYMSRLTENPIEEELQKNLKQVDQTLESIRHLAIDIDVQLRIQEPKVDRIHALVENSDVQMDGANEKVKKLLDS